MKFFKWGKIVFMLLLIYNIYYCKENIDDRYNGMFNQYYNTYMKSFSGIEPFNRQEGIKKTDLVISIPDISPNGSLYLMNQHGWTGFSSNFKQESFFESRIQQGAKYLFVSDSTLLGEDFLKKVTKNKLGQFESIAIFKLEK